MTIAARIKKELEQVNAQLTTILKPYKASLDFDKKRRTLTCSIKWKSGEGHKCSRGMGTWEEDGKLIAFRQGSDDDHRAITPKEAIAWLKSELFIYRHVILTK